MNNFGGNDGGLNNNFNNGGFGGGGAQVQGQNPFDAFGEDNSGMGQ